MTRAYTEAELAAFRAAFAPCPGVIGGGHVRYSTRSRLHGAEPRACYHCGQVMPDAAESWERRCERLLATLDERMEVP